MAQIRYATRNDQQGVSVLLRHLLEEFPDQYRAGWPDSASLDTEIEARVDRRLIVIATDHRHPIGAASWRPRVAHRDQTNIRYAALETLYVLGCHRRQRIARQLCEYVQAICKSHAIAELRADSPLGTGMAPLLSSVGFVTLDESRIWPPKSIPKALLASLAERGPGGASVKAGLDAGPAG